MLNYFMGKCQLVQSMIIFWTKLRGGFLIFILNTSTELPMKHEPSKPKLHQALVMPARVGMSVGAVRCLAEAWVWPDVLALRGSGHIREGKAMRHNDWLYATQRHIAVCYRILKTQ
jgi:hypothetical protein